MGTTSYRRRGNASAILLVPESRISLDDSSVKYGRTSLDAKDELHVTLLGGEAGKRLRRHMSDASAASQAILRAVEGRRLEFLRTGDLFVVEDVDRPSKLEGRLRFRRSIVERVEIPGVEGFWSSLESVLPGDVREVFEPPQYHLTLYTFHCPEETQASHLGIGLYSQEDWRQKVCWPVSASDLLPGA